MERLGDLMKQFKEIIEDSRFDIICLASKCSELWKDKQDSEFRNLKTNAEKVKFYYNFMKNNNLLPPMDRTEKKSESKSLAARNKGNQHFREKDYMAALAAYNEALCYSEGSESMGKVYANRSVIYLDTGFFDFCLENIQLALEHNYPENLKPKLLERKETCLKRMKTEKDSFHLYGKPNPLSLSYAAKPKMPFAANAMKCVKSEKYGRYIVATRDLKPGDILLLESPFVNAPIQKYLTSVCYHCFGNNFYNLMPCPKSPKVMFCSEKCATEAWERYYKFEFNVVGELYKWLPKTFAVRPTLKAFTMVENPDELKQLVDSIDTTSEHAFKIDFTCCTERDQFRAFYSLETNEMLRNDISYHSFVTNTAVIYHFLKESSPELRKMFEIPAYENLFLELAMRFGMIGDTNAFGIADTYHLTKDVASITCQGEGVYLTHSLYSHACCPNVENFQADNKGTFGLVVLRPIKSGDQLFISYGPDFTYEPKDERQRKLEKKYQFECQCMACSKNLSMHLQYKNILAVEHQQAMIDLNPNHCEFDEKIYKVAKKLKSTIPKLLTRYNRYYPSKELFQLMTCLVASIQIVAFKKPIEFVLTPKKQ